MYQIYQIKRDENLNHIAQKFNISIEELKKINGFEEENVVEGQYIIVPKLETNFFDTYKVKKGDTVYAIAKLYNTTFRDLLEINGLEENDYIYPNQEILVPSKGLIYHITNMGDTLESVSSKMNIRNEDILEQNKKIYLLPNQLVVYKETATK